MNFKSFLQSGRLRCQNEILTETPTLVKDTDFMLGDKKHNNEEAIRYLKKTPVEIYKETEDVLFARYGNTDNGVIVYIANKRERATINYFVEFEKVIVKNVNKSVFQSSVWRNSGAGLSNITSDIFYNVLFKFNDSICSDEFQTNDGMRFWKDRIADAIQKGYYVGLWDSFDEEIDWFDSKKESFQKWTDRVYDFAWDKTPEKASYRFFISKTKI